MRGQRVYNQIYKLRVMFPKSEVPNLIPRLPPCALAKIKLQRHFFIILKLGNSPKY